MALESIRNGYDGEQPTKRYGMSPENPSSKFEFHRKGNNKDQFSSKKSRRLERPGCERSKITLAQKRQHVRQAELLMTWVMVLAAMANDPRFPGPASS
jgi:hypothetical protein